MGKSRNNKFLIIIGLISVFFIGMIIGATSFPKTIEVPVKNVNGKYCYHTNQNYYLANPVTSLPSNWEYEGVSDSLCSQVNNGRNCEIAGVYPHSEPTKIECVCQE